MKTRLFTLLGSLMVLVLLLTSCSTAVPTKSSDDVTMPSAPTITGAPTSASIAIPQGEVVAAITGFGNENFLPWMDAGSASLYNYIYDMLIYWDHVNRVLLPGLAESWDISPDGFTTTFHLRPGVEFTEGWGELTSADVKYNFEMQASSKSIGKSTQTRRIASMDTPDPYTLVVHFKDAYHAFCLDMSMAAGGVCQGIVSKKYLDTVGEDVASQKPIGTGPYRLIESQSGSYFKFEALDSHWRLVPEFKILTVRLISETSTLVAALKNKEIDLAQVPADQMADLKSAGVAVEVSPVGGRVLVLSFGGLAIPQDTRYDASYHNKDPWADVRVRKAMSLAIDRAAICKAVFADLAVPLSVPMYGSQMDSYKYPYDPAAARQLLKDAGYPDGFSFKAISYVQSGVPEIPRIMEAMASYWQQIGLNPQISVIDVATYTRFRYQMKTAGDVSLYTIGLVGDYLSRIELFLMPNASNAVYQDAGSYAIYRDNPKATMEERVALLEKLNQYYFDNYFGGVLRVGLCYAWNSDKISPWPHHDSTNPFYLEYIRHAQPLNTYSLFRPWPDR